MPELSQREKVLISLMLAVMILLLGGLLVNKFAKYEARLTQNYKSKQQQLRQIQKLKSQWNGLQGVPTAPVMRGSLSSFVESIARRLRIQSRLQLNVLNNPTEGTEGVQVRIDQMNLDQLFDILYILEKKRPVLLIEQLDINRSPGTKLLRASFRVYKQRAV